MKKLFPVFIFCCISTAIVGQDYIIDYNFNNGYTLVYKNLSAPSALNKPDRLYGVINEANKIVVPIQYKSIRSTGEKGIFEIRDKSTDAGLYSVMAQKVIVEPQYFEIENFTNGLAVVKKRKPDFGFLWGAVDVNGLTVIPVEYEYLGSYIEGLMNFKKDGKLGFLDRNNNIVIPAMYDDFSSFYEGLAPVKTIPGGKYGYIDKNNNMVIAAQYEDANPFYSGYAVVAKKKGYSMGGAGKPVVKVPGEMTVIDKKGKEIMPMTFHNISPRSAGGLFIVELNGKKGVVDSAGRPILPIEYAGVDIDKNAYIIYKTSANKYGMMQSNGAEILAPKYDNVSHTSYGRVYSKLNGQYAVWGLNRNQVIPPDSANGVILGKKRIVYYYDDKVKITDLNGNPQKTIGDVVLKNYGHSLTETEDSIKLNMAASVQLLNLATNAKKQLPYGEAGDFNDEGIFITKKNKYDFYDHTGKKLNTESYYSVVNFSDGVGALQVSSTSTPHLADKNFKKIKDLYSYFKGPYSEGLAYATGGNSGKIYYLDKSGNEAFSVNAKEGSPSKEGFIAIKGNNGKYYHVNKKGKPINTKTWDEAGTFNEGLALVKENGKWGFIDTAGKIVVDLKYDESSNFSKGAAVVKTGGVYKLINKKGEAIGSSTYEAAGPPGNGSFPVQKNGLAGLVDSKGNTIVDFKYNNILFLSEDRVWASKDGKWGLLDNKGKPLTEFIYQGAYDFNGGYARVVKNDKIGVVNKSGKLIVPHEYKSLGSVYKNVIIAIKPEGSSVVPIK